MRPEAQTEQGWEAEPMSNLVEHWDAVYRRTMRTAGIRLGRRSRWGCSTRWAFLRMRRSTSVAGTAPWPWPCSTAATPTSPCWTSRRRRWRQGGARLGEASDAVSWLVADIRCWQPERSFDLWHDRAVFHFLVEPADREAYGEAMQSGTAPGAVALIGTFAAEGPTQCSGLPVSRLTRLPGRCRPDGVRAGWDCSSPRGRTTAHRPVRASRSPGLRCAALRELGSDEDGAVIVLSVGGCCDPRGCDQMFDARFAFKSTTLYRKKGLDGPADGRYC